MPSAPKKVVLSEKEKLFQQELKQEKELTRLNREYHVLDRQRQRCLNAGYPKLEKIKKVVNIFRNEYDNICADLSVAVSAGNERKDRLIQDNLHQLLEEYALRNEQVKNCNTQMLEVKSQISKVAKSVLALQKKQFTDRKYQEYVHQARHTLEAVENKLETEMKKFNATVTQNKKLREEIDHLLWERRNFLSIWNTLIEKLNCGKRIMLDMIQQATLAYDQAEELCTKLQLLRITGHKDFTINTDKIRACTMSLDQNLKLEDFYSIKSQKRFMRDMIKKEKVKRSELEKKLSIKKQEYEEIISEVQQFTKEQDTEVIAHNYYIREAENFTKFNYIIDLIKEMETVNDRLTVLASDIEEEQYLLGARADQQKDTLEKLTGQLKEKQKERQKCEDETKELRSKLDQMMKGIWQLFKICKCHQDPILKLLGDNQKVHDYNVLLYLKVMEDAINKYLLQLVYQTSTSAKGSASKNFFTFTKIDNKMCTIEKIVTSTPCSLCAEHEMVSDIFDQVERPLTKDGASRKLQQRLALPNGKAIIHKLSQCHLPAARKIQQKAYE